MSIKLIDLYSGNKFNPAQIVADGYSGVIFKAGQGSWADVPRYHPDWWGQAAEYGLHRGWYWLCDSRRPSSEHIREMRAWRIFQDVGEYGIWIDMEKPMIAMSETDYWKTPYAGYKNVVDFAYLIRIEGHVPGIYTGPGAYELIMRGAPNSAHEYLATHELWTAQYPWVYVPGISKPKLYGKWKTWTWWQYQEGPDVNLFNGMNDEYYAKYGEGIPSPPELPTIPGGNMATLRASAKQDGVNVKDQVTGTILATLKIGWEVDGDMSTARTDLVNIKVYRKGSGFPDITLAKLAKCSLSGLNTPYPIPSIPPPDPEPQVWPPSFILENEVTHARQRYIKE